MNITKQAFDINNNSFFNPGCADELEKMAVRCTDFKAQVLSTMSTRFKIAVIVLVIMIIIRFILQYKLQGNSTIDFIIKRLDWVIVLLGVCTIGMMFI